MLLKVEVHLNLIKHFVQCRTLRTWRKYLIICLWDSCLKFNKLWSSLELNNEGYSGLTNTFHTLSTCIKVNLIFSSNSDRDFLTHLRHVRLIFRAIFSISMLPKRILQVIFKFPCLLHAHHIEPSISSIE